MSTSNVGPLVVGAFIGLVLGCAGAKPKPDTWYDACCSTCTEHGCEDCSASKDGCEGAREAECMLHDDVTMCRPKQAARH